MTREAIQLRYRMCVAGLLVILAAACALMYHFHVNGTAAHIRRCTQSISVSATPTRNGRSLGVANNSFLESQSDSVNADGDLTGGYDYNISYTYGGRSYHISEYSRERRTGSSMALYINPGNPKEYYIPGISVTVEDARRHFLYFCIAAPVLFIAGISFLRAKRKDAIDLLEIQERAKRLREKPMFNWEE